MPRTQQVSAVDRKIHKSSETNQMILGDRIEAASVLFVASKDGSNSHENLAQINLRIGNDSN